MSWFCIFSLAFFVLGGVKWFCQNNLVHCLLSSKQGVIVFKFSKSPQRSKSILSPLNLSLTQHKTHTNLGCGSLQAKRFFYF